VDSLFIGNLTSPPLLFFLLGVLAAAVRSDLDVPAQIAKFLSIYLLFAIGFKGGVALSESDIDGAVVTSLVAAVALATLIPIGVFFAVRRLLAAADAAAVAATYGSISAVTFVTATGYLDAQGVSWGGHLVAAMALMEMPAIVVGLVLFQRHGEHVDQGTPAGGSTWLGPLRESALNGSVLLIVGSLVAGWITGPAGMSQVAPLVQELFIGLLCLFLLDMGIVAARRIRELGRSTKGGAGPGTLVVFALALPLINALISALVAWQLGLDEGDALLLTVLGASASYIAVPAAMRLALPEANPSIYLTMSLGVTFPFNILVGIPLYHAALRALPGVG
jgi:uncharacterized protein